MNADLYDKYNVPGPRYTSYPTVPYWEGTMDQALWSGLVKTAFGRHQDEGISVYIHLPYCESLCTYCGCNTRITVNHAVEGPYIDAVLKEWSMYLALFDSTPLIREVHLGGGTPTFFSPNELRRLMEGLMESSYRHPQFEFGFEGHPANTTHQHLQTLYDLGFTRVSFGIQDFGPKVQDAIHRFQSVEQVRDVTNFARSIGYKSVNYDLIYGLPFQKLESIRSTVDAVRELKPDRIAFYSYAHVPWIKPGQRKFTELDLPNGFEKRLLYETGRSLLEDAGYVEIGMDHFALPNDELYRSVQTHSLHRNFMGYTPASTHLLVGLGVSSIGDSWTGFAQNVKVVEEYLSLVSQGELPLFRGHALNEEDLIVRQHILNLMCRFHTSWATDGAYAEALDEGWARLEEMEQDGLIIRGQQSVTVTPAGRSFVRNICMAFDARLWRKQPSANLFSQTV